MDMCITPPEGIEIAEDARPKLITNIAAALEQLGMAEVEPRATARIPYVVIDRPTETQEDHKKQSTRVHTTDSDLLPLHCLPAACCPRLLLTSYISRWTVLNCVGIDDRRICMFSDPSTGVECDISVHNALALRNTQLLRMYSLIDTRVRWLAYTLKRW